jgi:NAD-dependent DNA ligase
MAEKTAESFVERIPDFIKFIKEAGLVKKLSQSIATEKKPVDESHPLFGKSIVMTGFRDSEVIDFIKKVGGKLTTSVSKNTFLIIIKSDGEENNKVQDAIQLKIPILTLYSFKKKYMHVG